MKVISHPGFPATPIYVPDAARASSIEILIGRFNFVRAKGEPMVRRLLDLAPHCGVFAAWFILRFPYAWIDMVEGDDDRRKLCALNAPPGARVMKSDVAGFVDEVVRAGKTIGVDAIHSTLEDLPVEQLHWPALKLAIIEHAPSDLDYVCGFFSPDFQLVAADRGFTAWVRS